MSHVDYYKNIEGSQPYFKISFFLLATRLSGSIRVFSEFRLISDNTYIQKKNLDLTLVHRPPLAIISSWAQGPLVYRR